MLGEKTRRKYWQRAFVMLKHGTLDFYADESHVETMGPKLKLALGNGAVQSATPEMTRKSHALLITGWQVIEEMYGMFYIGDIRGASCYMLSTYPRFGAFSVQNNDPTPIQFLSFLFHHSGSHAAILAF